MQSLGHLVIRVEAEGTRHRRSEADPTSSLLIPDIPTLASDALRAKHELRIFGCVELKRIEFRLVDSSSQIETITGGEGIHVVLRPGFKRGQNVAGSIPFNICARLGQQRRMAVTRVVGFAGCEVVRGRWVAAPGGSASRACSDDADLPLRCVRIIGVSKLGAPASARTAAPTDLHGIIYVLLDSATRDEKGKEKKAEKD